MKITQLKENKLKKATIRRITKHEGYSIGDAAYLDNETMNFYLKERDEFVIRDRTEMKYELYLLVRSMKTNKVFIFKAIDECLCVNLDSKKLAENKEFFENASNWEAHTAIKIDIDRDVYSISN